MTHEERRRLIFGESAPKCLCGAAMVQEMQDHPIRSPLQEFIRMDFATPTGKFYCVPCEDNRRDLMEACVRALRWTKSGWGSGSKYLNADRARDVEFMEEALQKARGLR